MSVKISVPQAKLAAKPDSAGDALHGSSAEAEVSRAAKANAHKLVVAVLTRGAELMECRLQAVAQQAQVILL